MHSSYVFTLHSGRGGCLELGAFFQVLFNPTPIWGGNCAKDPTTCSVYFANLRHAKKREFDSNQGQNTRLICLSEKNY